VLVVDEGLVSLQRLWCLYEVFWAEQHGKGGAVVRVALPHGCASEVVVKLHEGLCAGVDLAKAECTREKDATQVGVCCCLLLSVADCCCLLLTVAVCC
jgi:hypothetical protein